MFDVFEQVVIIQQMYKRNIQKVFPADSMKLDPEVQLMMLKYVKGFLLRRSHASMQLDIILFYLQTFRQQTETSVLLKFIFCFYR